ncbi:MAG: hypothetical protein GX146_12350 [Myxococcales bacterium]|jgi:hypothetical protein|nr:hypothetical protein [Myxococcales bacterium]
MNRPSGFRPAGAPTPADWFAPALLLLLAAATECTLYRLFAAVNLYAGVGALGPRALMANLAAFSLILTGVLSLVLLIFALARLVLHPAIPSLLFRSVLVLTAPLYMLVTATSLWLPLPHVAILAAIGTALFTVVFVAAAVLIFPLQRLIRWAVMAMPLMLLGATAAWFMLDLLSLDPHLPAGRMAVAAHQVSELLFLALPIVLVPALLCQPNQPCRIQWHTLHWPALGIATSITIGIAYFVLQHAPTPDALRLPALLHTPDFLRHITYRTLKVTLWFKGSVTVALLATFCATFLIAALLIPFRGWRTDASTRSIALGLAFIYIAGLQPFAVYLMTLSLLGFLMFFSGLIDKYARESHSQKETPTPRFPTPAKTPDTTPMEEPNAIARWQKNI